METKELVKIPKEAIKTIAKGIKKPIIFYDLETSTLPIEINEIVQFAAIKIFPNGKHEKLEFLCSTVNPIDPNATAVHGISDQDVAHLPLFKDHIEDIERLFKDSDIGGFNNKRFDDKILQKQLKDLGKEDLLKNARVVDVYQIFCKHVSRKLENALHHYCSEKLENAHEALADIVATVKCYAKQLEVEGLDTEQIIEKFDSEKEKPNDLSKYLIKEKGEWIINFSKNKGTKLKDCEKSFLKWICQKDFPQCLKDTIKPYLK